MLARSFEDVEIWKKAHAFVLKVYRLTENFPKHELFGLTSQLRRAAVSVPANFAEGFKKIGKADKLRFYNIAQGSLEECRYYLILTKDLNYGDIQQLKSDATEVSKMLESYMQKIRNDR
ncbi:MAG: four helix bundle protein [Pyrinomonadaceae bacterium]|nr:four helix bundle protein [Pyrinomonadaceae bacterium]